MDNKIFPTLAIEAKHRSGLLGNHFDCFISWMREYGYSRHSMRFNVQCVTHFDQYLHREEGFALSISLNGKQVKNSYSTIDVTVNVGNIGAKILLENFICELCKRPA